MFGMPERTASALFVVNADRRNWSAVAARAKTARRFLGRQRRMVDDELGASPTRDRFDPASLMLSLNMRTAGVAGLAVLRTYTAS